MKEKNQILENKINFLMEVTEEELFNHFFVRNQQLMIRLCNRALESSGRDREVIRFASDILNVIDPDWFKGEKAIARKKGKIKKD